MPLAHPSIEPFCGIVVPINLDVNETDIGLRKSPLHGTHDIHDRATSSARAEFRCGEDDDEWLMRGEALGNRVAQEGGQVGLGLSRAMNCRGRCVELAFSTGMPTIRSRERRFVAGQTRFLGHLLPFRQAVCQHPVLTRAGDVQIDDVEVGYLTLGPTWNANLLQSRNTPFEWSLTQSSGDPDLSRGSFDRCAVISNDQKRIANLAWRKVRGPRSEGHRRAGSLLQGPQGFYRVDG